MKTEKEIKDRMELHQNNLDIIEKKLSDERSKFFGGNKKLIKVLMAMRTENRAAVVFLSWTLI
jgi:CRISPR/Cas system CMR subunit Cmr6 (Cas7 group RAMP superfamily)